MIEVFKTNVQNQWQANRIIALIHNSFTDYRANFDLEDCDKILRVKSFNGFVQTELLIDLLKALGFDAKVLPDDLQVTGGILAKQKRRWAEENNMDKALHLFK